jgi:hypothetical protein
MSEQKQSEFEKAGQAQNASIVSEFIAMLKVNKKYWLLPIVIAMLLVGVVVVLSSTAAAPFVYTLF